MASRTAVSALPWHKSMLDVDPRPRLLDTGATLVCLCLGGASALAFRYSGIRNRTYPSSNFHGRHARTLEHALSEGDVLYAEWNELVPEEAPRYLNLCAGGRLVASFESAVPRTTALPPPPSTTPSSHLALRTADPARPDSRPLDLASPTPDPSSHRRHGPKGPSFWWKGARLEG
jgi:hypothetical protein